MIVARGVLLTPRIPTIYEHHLIQVLSLIKAATIICDCSLKLVLDGTHYEFVGGRFVGHFLGADTRVSLMLLLVLRDAVVGSDSLLLGMLAPILINWNSAFEVEDVVLDGGERAIIADIEARRSLLLLLLTILKDLYLGPFDR